MSTTTQTGPVVIAAKFAGRCKGCGAAVKVGQLVTWTKGEKGVSCGVCVEQPEVNPWIDAHVQGEMNFTGDGYTRSMARRAVAWEYEGAPRSIPCSCGGRAHYKATIGAMKCPSCDALFTVNGAVI